MKQLLITISMITLINLVVLGGIVIARRPYSLTSRLLVFIIISPGFAVLFNLLRYLGILVDYPYMMAVDYWCNFAWPPVFLITENV